ncbi:MAG: MarR family transcriptional regulator [Clostridium sp.]|uniref:MarR family transcriptional regulator n=1 Tax=Clostridium sp. TaxID=1506 RepID=UPI0039ECD6D5
MSAKDIVIKTLSEAESPLKTGDIVSLANVDKKEIEKAIKELKAEGKIVSPKRCYYTVNR